MLRNVSRQLCSLYLRWYFWHPSYDSLALHGFVDHSDGFLLAVSFGIGLLLGKLNKLLQTQVGLVLFWIG